VQLETIAWTSPRGWPAALPDLDSPSTLVVAFGDRSLEAEREPLDELLAAYPESVITGCSTSGEIAGTRLCDSAVSVAIVRFERTRLVRAAADVRVASGSATAGSALASQLNAADLRAVFVLSDGLQVNGSDLVRDLVGGLGADVVVTGGLAGDGDRFERTWVIDNGELRAGRAVAVGFYGESLEVGYGSQGGWGIFGPERTVTRSEGNVLYELDGKPALAVYRRYLGDLASGLPATALLFPLAVRSEREGEQLVRTVLAVDEEAQTMTFAGDVPQGWLAQLMRASPGRLVDGAATAAGMSAPIAANGGPTLGIAISCVGRRLVLGERTEEEIEATFESLPERSELVGFYSYGEIAPGATGFCDLHNQTMTVTTLAER